MNVYPSHNLKPKTDLDGTFDKNPADGLIRPMRELAKFVTKTSSKVREPKTYDKTINDIFQGNKWRKGINEELWILDLYQI